MWPWKSCFPKPIFEQKRALEISAPFPYEVFVYTKSNFFRLGAKYGLMCNHMQIFITVDQ